MDWLEVKIYTTTEGIEHVGGMLLMLGIAGFAVEDKNDYEQFVSETQPHWDYVDESLERLRTVETSVTFYLPEDAGGREQLALVRTQLERVKALDTENCLGRLCMEVNGLAQSDWENGWKKYFKPFTVGQKLLVQPSWETASAQDGRCVLTIDPGMSFGTGQHHTTRLCLQALEETIRSGDRILDLGSGSGILSIASLLLGAEHATAVDIDEFAVKISRENAALNGFSEDRYTALQGDILTDDVLKEKIRGTYSVVVANIVADVLIAFAPVFRQYMAPESRLICSGIIDSRLSDVKAVFDAQGYRLLRERGQADWHALELMLGGQE